jgi:LacI family transcriptional regulator
MVDRPTIHDLAKKAGVSVATVDRVLNRRLPVRDDTARRVVAAAEAIGFHATGLLKRRLTETPLRRFGFLLQKPDAFYHLFSKELVSATKSAHQIDGKPTVEFMAEVEPAFIAERIRAVAPKVDALAVVPLDYPQVNEAVEWAAAQGTPCFTLLSNISTPACAGHLGIDGRRNGRIAAWTISRLARGAGKIGILVGSHRYLHQEQSEISFRTYMREHASQFQLMEPIVNLDDDDIAYEAVWKMAKDNKDLVGIYVSGGGQHGLVRALRERGNAPKIVAVCNELTEPTRAALHDEVVDMALGTPIAAISKRLVEMMIKAATVPDSPRLAPILLPPEILISENI